MDTATDYAPAATTPRPRAMTAGIAQQQARELGELRNLYTLAIEFPRDTSQARANIQQAFTHLRMAEVAQYQYAKGGTDIAGPSIHSAQTIGTLWGNLDFGWRVTGRGVGEDGRAFTEVMCWATDLQTRARSNVGIVVPHWRDTKGGGYPIREEREVKELIANMAQRTKRGCILQLIPQDVVDEAMETAEATLAMKADTSPEGLRKMVDTFKEFGVTKAQIEAFVQRKLGAIGKPQVVQLKRIYVSLRDGLSMPQDWFPPLTEAGGADATGGTEQSPPRSATEKAKDAIKRRTKGKGAPEAGKPAETAAGTDAAQPGRETPPYEMDTPGRKAERASEPTAEGLRDKLMQAADRDAAMLVMDLARHLPRADYDSLVELLEQRYPDG
jgi:hypothetical protein